MFIDCIIQKTIEFIHLFEYGIGFRYHFFTFEPFIRFYRKHIIMFVFQQIGFGEIGRKRCRDFFQFPLWVYFRKFGSKFRFPDNRSKLFDIIVYILPQTL